MICIQVASQVEWSAVEDMFEEADIHQSPYGPYLDTLISDRTCRIYYSGYSKTKASGAAQYAISSWSPTRMFVCGTCGGVSDALALEDVIIASETVFYDCIDRLTVTDQPFFPYLDTRLTPPSICQREGYTIHTGRIATADQDIDLNVRNKLKPLGVLAADWESASVAHVCRLNKIPLTVLRGVSDIPGLNGATTDDQASSYMTLAPRIMHRLILEVLPAVLDLTENRRIS